MKCNYKKVSIILIILLLIFNINITLAHSGRTDSNGGHKDKNNVSGLGSYHYHCDGNPAHLHTNGICKYSSNKSTSSSNIKVESKKSPNIIPTGININEKITDIRVGENRKLTTTIIPLDTTNKDVIWKSSDESVAVVNSSGELIAKRGGTVKISVNTYNGKESTIQVIVEEIKEENNIIQTSTTASKINNEVEEKQEESNPISGIVGFGLLSGIVYLIYKKLKK